MAGADPLEVIDSEVCARWRLTAGPALTDRLSGTWEASRDDAALIVKYFDDATFPDWRYSLRVAAALRDLGWPTPEPVEEPLIGMHGAWVLLRRLPGRSLRPADKDQSRERRARGRLLAEFHAAAATLGIDDQRGGFSGPADVVTDPELEYWLRRHEIANPEQGGVLRRCQEAAASWFVEHADVDAPRSVIHRDFTPWNLLYDGGRLSGLLDFEATHHTFQVADFALSWRGYQDDVLEGYDEVRALSDLEWHLVQPTYWACSSHAGRHSPLITRKTGVGNRC